MRLTKRERHKQNKIAAETLLVGLGKESLPWIAIDCSFNHIMTEFEQTSLVVQIQESYSHLRKHADAARMCVCSVDQALDKKIEKQGGREWVIHTTSDPVESWAKEKKVIVMSPDADKEISSEDIEYENTVFVIGGIVDRLVSRNETAHKAIKLGFEARKVPADSDKFINKVFNIDSVFHFLLRCFQERGQRPIHRERMVDILLQVLPERKKKDAPAATSDKNQVKLTQKSEQNKVDPCNTVKIDRYRLLELFS
jgi:hypothetical protein